ncbi:hypothetical protein RFI_30681, partial [Reticulomyxa filosa]
MLSSFGISELRARFKINLQAFLGKDDLKEPVLCRVQVYLYDLFMKVMNANGYDQVCQSQLWTQIALQLSVKSTNSAYQVKKTYETYLLDYEQAHCMPFFDPSRMLDKPPSQRFDEMLQGLQKPKQIIYIYIYYKLGKDKPGRELLCLRCKEDISVGDGIGCWDCGDNYHKKCTSLPANIGGSFVWHCEDCESLLNQKFGYETGLEYNVHQYQQRSEQLS